ncbi:MAG: hypothetical protein R3B91_05820 [Planctomycetaceae bacterium]
MIIIWGSGLYGRTDEVPGLGHVATKFGHLWYIPLIPTGSHFVIEQTGDGWRGASVPLSGKSVLVGLLRAALVVGSIAGAVTTVVAFSGPNPAEGWEALIVTIALIVALIMTMRMKFFTQASYTRACQLADTIGFSDEARIIIDLTYGEITQQEAEFRMNEIGEDGQNAFEGNEEFESHSETS